MNKLDKQYTDLLQDILNNGVTKETRNGSTISVFGRQLRHDFRDGFPLLTTKRMAWKQIVTELLWFLRGDTNIKFLVDNDCHIWDGDAYKNYVNKIKLQNNWEVTLRVMNINTIGQQELLSKEEFINKIKTDDEFAKKWGELGPIYGKQWREWSNYRAIDPESGISCDYRKRDSIDQIENLINDLKTNPDSRRLMVSAWNVGELDKMVLPPCHYSFQVYTRELDLDERAKLHSHPELFYNINGRFSVDDNIENSNYPSKDRIWLHEQFDKGGIPKRAISLMWNQRSVDTFLGLPFNIASYGLLLEIIAKEVNMVPDQLIGNLGDVHLYSNHIEQAKEQIGRTPYELPTLKIKSINDNHMIYPKLLPLTGEEEFYEISDFILENYQSHPTIKAPLSN